MEPKFGLAEYVYAYFGVSDPRSAVLHVRYFAFGTRNFMWLGAEILRRMFGVEKEASNRRLEKIA